MQFICRDTRNYQRRMWGVLLKRYQIYLIIFRHSKKINCQKEHSCGGILGNLRTDAYKTLLDDSKKAWTKGDEENNDLIKIHPEILEKLITAPNITEDKTYVIIYYKFRKR